MVTDTTDRYRLSDAIILRARGFSLRQIADRLGVSKSTVHRWLEEPQNRRELAHVVRYLEARRRGDPNPWPDA